MPEGDTIFRTARSLHQALAGHRATNFDTAYAHVARVNDEKPIAGRLIERCEAAGKHVLIVFEGDLMLRIHMRMNGSWHLYRHGERWWRGPQAMRVRVDTEAWVAVAFDVPVGLPPRGPAMPQMWHRHRLEEDGPRRYSHLLVSRLPGRRLRNAATD